MKKLQILAFFLALLLLLSAFAGCGKTDDSEKGETENGSETAAQSGSPETDAGNTLAVPDKKYGREFKILTCPGENETTKMYWVHAGFNQLNGDQVNDQLVDRNNYINEKLGVNMVVDTRGKLTDTSAMQNAVSSGEDDVQLGIWIDRFALNLAMNGMVSPVSELERYYVNLQNPWWYQTMNKELTLGGDLYFAAGYFNIDLFGGMHVLAFNKDMVNDYALDDPYELVAEGKWTMENMLSMMQIVSTEAEPRDGERIWGAVYDNTFWTNNFITVSGENYIKKNQDDLPYLAVIGNERLFDIFSMIVEDLSNNQIADSRLAQTKYNVGHVYENVINMFANEVALFAGTAPVYLDRMRGSNMDYGVAPFPTYEEKQPGDPYSSYITGVVAHFVPSSVRDYEMVSAVLETMAYLSWKNIIPSYVEKVLEIKNERNEESGDMLRMLDRNRVLELGQTYWYDAVIADVILKVLDSPGRFVSAFTAAQESIEKVLDDTVVAFERIRNK